MTDNDKPWQRWTRRQLAGASALLLLGTIGLIGLRAALDLSPLSDAVLLVITGVYSVAGPYILFSASNAVERRKNT